MPSSEERAALYRQKAETSRTLAEGMGTVSARAAIIEVAIMWSGLADDQEKDRTSRQAGLIASAGSVLA
jgi:hypothetical protein